MDITPVRCRIPEHLEAIKENQTWLAMQAGISKQQLNDYVKMRYLLGIEKARHISQLLKLNRIDDLYEWGRSEE